jgi:formamidopyrimidine-DNA glycosylase
MRHATAELPELAATAAHLDRLLRRERLERLDVALPGSLKSTEPPLDRVAGARVTGARRRGREVAVEADGIAVVASLGTSGWMAARPPGRGSGRRRHLPTFRLVCAGGTAVEMVETMNRKDGAVRLAPSAPPGADGAGGAGDGTGGDPTDAAWGPAAGPDELRAGLARAGGPVRAALTAGGVDPALGPAWADEALHRARLAPVHPAEGLARDEVERLHRALDATVRHAAEALAAEPLNELRQAALRLRRVSGHAGEPCPTCGATLAEAVVGGGEPPATYCPPCQTGGELLPDPRRAAFVR